MMTHTMSDGSSINLNVLYNQGLERGRKHQERGGYPAPAFVLELPEQAQNAYLTGWQKGYDTTTWLGALRRRV